MEWLQSWFSIWTPIPSVNEKLKAYLTEKKDVEVVFVIKMPFTEMQKKELEALHIRIESDMSTIGLSAMSVVGFGKDIQEAANTFNWIIEVQIPPTLVPCGFTFIAHT